MLAGFHLKKKAVNAMKSPHEMFGIWRVESDMLTHTYHQLMEGGPRKFEGPRYNLQGLGDRCPRISFLQRICLTMPASFLKPHLRKPDLSSSQKREQYLRLRR